MSCLKGVWDGGMVCGLDFYARPLYIFRRFEHLPDFLERVQVFLFKHFCLLKVLHRVLLPPLILRVKVIIY